MEKSTGGQAGAQFKVTDGNASVEVVYKGILPDLFREGQGVVVLGVEQPNGVFRASEVLAKHDATYMPKEVADALKKSGRWNPADRFAAARVHLERSASEASRVMAASSVQVCIMGAGPVGGTLACRLASAGVSVALIDRAALPPMENPAFDGRAYAIAAGRVRCWRTLGFGTSWTSRPIRSATSASVTDASAVRRLDCICISTIVRPARIPGHSAGWWRHDHCARP